LKFGGSRNDSSDTTPALQAALAACKAQRTRKLIFPQGTYHFWPRYAMEAYVYASNNDAFGRHAARMG
jgi:hypothetical protein